MVTSELSGNTTRYGFVFGALALWLAIRMEDGAVIVESGCEEGDFRNQCSKL